MNAIDSQLALMAPPAKLQLGIRVIRNEHEAHSLEGARNIGTLIVGERLNHACACDFLILTRPTNHDVHAVALAPVRLCLQLFRRSC